MPDPQQKDYVVNLIELLKQLLVAYSLSPELSKDEKEKVRLELKKLQKIDAEFINWLTKNF